jgi:hypothetical protein
MQEANEQLMHRTIEHTETTEPVAIFVDGNPITDEIDMIDIIVRSHLTLIDI